MKIQTQTLHFKADSHLLSFVEQKMGKLDRFFNGIIHANVVLKLENKAGKIKNKVIEVKMNLPGGVLYVKETSKSFEASVDSAMNTLRTQLLRFKSKKNQKR